LEAGPPAPGGPPGHEPLGGLVGAERAGDLAARLAAPPIDQLDVAPPGVGQHGDGGSVVLAGRHGLVGRPAGVGLGCQQVDHGGAVPGLDRGEEALGGRHRVVVAGVAGCGLVRRPGHVAALLVDVRRLGRVRLGRGRLVLGGRGGVAVAAVTTGERETAGQPERGDDDRRAGQRQPAAAPGGRGAGRVAGGGAGGRGGGHRRLRRGGGRVAPVRGGGRRRGGGRGGRVRGGRRGRHRAVDRGRGGRGGRRRGVAGGLLGRLGEVVVVGIGR